MSQFTVNDLRSKIQVTEEEASVLLSVSKATLIKWRASGDGPPCFSMGRMWHYPVKALDHWAMRKVAEVSQ